MTEQVAVRSAPSPERLTRPPRLRRIPAPLTIRFPDAPAPPLNPPRTPIARALLVGLLPATLPPLGLVIATLAMGQQSQMVVTSVVLVAALGLGMLMTTLLSRRDEDARQAANQAEYLGRQAAHVASMQAIERTCREHVEIEREALNISHPAPDELVRRAADKVGIWSRLPSDDDFLHLRLGVGVVRSSIVFADESGRDDLAQGIRERYGRLGTVPVGWDMRKSPLTGIFGADDTVGGLLNAVILQAAAGHAPGDLRIAVFSQDEDLIHCAKWLPHAAIAGSSTDTLVARSGRGLGVALQALSEIADGADKVPGYLIVADVRSWPDLLGRLGTWLRRPGGVVLVVGKELADLPSDCDAVIRLTSDPAVVGLRVDTQPPTEFKPDQATAKEAVALALSLAAYGLSSGSGRQPIPRSVNTVDLLGRSALTPEGIAAAWSASRARFKLSAPIGAKSGGQVLEIDLRKDGPHGLIAGTTGSGKSELLQTLIASMAATIPPDLINFLLIDYKGGSAFREIKDLPHVVGMVTDLDDRLAARALTSLRAELHRRETLFAQVDPPAKDIKAYQSKPRDVRLANVVIIIDEFHRLVSEQPDFINQIVRIAQQGRSLGVHLILATQKPSGVVSDHIRANTNLRICLRVTDDADSRDVIGIPDAARISKELPGRVYVKVGSEEPEVAQTARTSGRIDAPGQGGAVSASWFLRRRPRAVRVGGVTVWPIESATRSDDSTTFVEGVDGRAALLTAIEKAAAVARIPTQQAPWTDPLPEALQLESLATDGNASGGSRGGPGSGSVVVGLLDEPEIQRQRPFEIDLGKGHVLVAGGANTGKTTALLTISQALAAGLGPDRLHIYGVDFAGGGLDPLATLPHCGGIARQYDTQSLTWLLGALGEFVAGRSALGPKKALELPAILVVIDNFVGLSTSLQSWEDPGVLDDLLEIMDAGRSVGVSFLISAERPEAIRSGVLATIGTRLVLPLSDAAGYGALGLWHTRPSQATIPGRATLADGVGHEVQIALPRPWEEFGTGRGKVKGGPLRITPLPATVAYSAVLEDAAAHTDHSGLVLGLKEGTEPVFRYADGEHLLVLGPRGSGRSNTLAVALLESHRQGVCSWVWNTRRSASLKRFCPDEAGGKDVQYAEPSSGSKAWAELEREVDARRAALESGKGGAPVPLMVVIDDAETVDIPISSSELLNSLVLTGPDLGMRLIVAASTQALRAKYPSDWIRAMLTLRRGILLGPQSAEDFDFFGVRGRPQRMPKGRGFVCGDGARHMIQIALAE